MPSGVVFPDLALVEALLSDRAFGNGAFVNADQVIDVFLHTIGPGVETVMASVIAPLDKVVVVKVVPGGVYGGGTWVWRDHTFSFGHGN